MKTIEKVLAELKKSPAGFDAAQRAIVEALGREFGLSRVTIMLYNRESNMLESVSAVGVPNIDHRNIRAPVVRVDGISSRAVEARAFIENRPIVVRDRSPDPQYRIRHRFPHKSYSREFAVFPLSLRNRKLGIVAVAVDDENRTRLTPKVTSRIASLAPRIAEAVGAALPRAPTSRAMIRILNRVLEENLLSMAYQPIVEAASGKIHGCEALLRVDHPDLDGPSALFHHAEKLNMLRDFSFYSHRTALGALESMGAGRKLFLNLHPKDFVEYEDIECSTNPFRGVDLSRIVFEITERYYMANVDRVQSIIRFFSELGVGIALDDLGSGYSSLEVLTTIEPSYIKIDRSLVSDIHRNDRKRKMMQALLYYCGETGATCIAEGVEVREEYEVLREMKCPLLQGYYLFRPRAAFPTGAEARSRVAEIRGENAMKSRGRRRA